MAGVVEAGEEGEGERATGTRATGTVLTAAQSGQACRPVRISPAAASAVLLRKPGPDPDLPSLANNNTSSASSSASQARSKDQSWPGNRTRCEDPSFTTDLDHPGKVSEGRKEASLNGQRSVSQHGEDPSGFSRSSAPSPVLPLLPKVADLPETDSEAFAGASSLASATFSTFFLPLPPVSCDMAEAIKRQQKGAGSVRYWKTKHLQSGRAHPPLPFTKSERGGVPNGLFPVLKPPSLHGSGNGVGANVHAPPAAASRLSKAKERLIRQKGGKEQGLIEFRRSLTNANANANVGKSPVYHTQYMYGHSLGDYPPPPPAYRRSVTALASLLSLPLPHPPHQLTQPSCPSNPQLTDLTRPNAALTLTQLPLQGPGRPSANSPDGVVEQENDLRTQGGEPGEVSHKKATGGTAAVAELTCLQLADAILSAKAADLSQYYQICQTKIRYVDFLERSATFRALDAVPPTKPLPTHHHHPPAKTQPASFLHPHPHPHPHLHPHLSPRLNTWVPSLDLKDPEIPNDVTAPQPSSSSSPRRLEDIEPVSKERRTPVALPSLGATSLSQSSGLRMSHGMFPSSGKTFLSSTFGDSEVSPATTTSSVGGPVPAMPSGKPILKPFNPDAIPVKIQRPYDPFSPRSVYSDLTGTACPAPLSVRGTTMYPLGASTEESRCALDRPEEKSVRRSQSSKSRKEAEMRKRAVRFSISDQVYEFAPGEPLAP